MFAVILAVILVVILAREGKKITICQEASCSYVGICLHRVGEGDLELLHEAEEAGSQLPAVGRGLADNRPALHADTGSTEKSSEVHLPY